MSKYIDADKLIAEIKGLQCEQGFDTGDAERAYQFAIKDILASIDSLQQEQPVVCEPEYGPYARQYPKSKVSQEQPEVDLEKEIGHWLDKLDDKYCMLVEDYSIQDIKDTARYFAEWGAIHLNSRKEE